MSAATSRTGYAGSMLPELWRLELHGQVVPNVEGLCRGVLNRQMRKLGRPLEDCDYAESLAHLLGEVVVLSAKFEPRPGIKLAPWLHTMLTFRLLDYWENRFGRHGEKRVIDARTLEAMFRDAGAEGGDFVFPEPIDESLQADVEEYVCGYIDLYAVLRAAPVELPVKSGRRRRAAVPARAAPL